MRGITIPNYDLMDYHTGEQPVLDIHVGRIEDTFTVLPKRLKVHRHEHFEVFWLNGEGSLFLDFKEHAISGPTLVIVSPGQVHGWPTGSGLNGTMTGFGAAFFDDGEAGSLMSYPFVYDATHPAVFSVQSDPETARVLDDLSTQMEREFRLRREGWSRMLRHQLHLVFTWASRLHEAGRPQTAPDRAVDQARAFRLAVEKRFRETTSVGDYARALGLSVGRLNEILREQAGRPAGELIRERILLEARRLLLHSTRSVSEIGFELGFRDPSYFARFFRRETGMPPGDYRAMVRREAT